MVLKVYDIKKSQQSDLHFAGSFCLVYQAKLTNSKRYILHICDFSRGRLNVSLPVHIQTAATKVTNIGAMTLFGSAILPAANSYLINPQISLAVSL